MAITSATIVGITSAYNYNGHNIDHCIMLPSHQHHSPTPDTIVELCEGQHFLRPEEAMLENWQSLSSTEIFFRFLRKFNLVQLEKLYKTE